MQQDSNEELLCSYAPEGYGKEVDSNISKVCYPRHIRTMERVA